MLIKVGQELNTFCTMTKDFILDDKIISCIVVIWRKTKSLPERFVDYTENKCKY